MRLLFRFGALALFLCFRVVSARDDSFSSKEYEGIVAIVNRDVITSSDLKKRLAWTLFSIGENSSSPEAGSRLSREVLREMINEHLKWQCAMKYAPPGGWATDEETEAVFSSIAKRGGLDRESFCKMLKQKNIDKDVLLKQIRVNLAWSAYVSARYGKFINISESEIKRTLADIKEKRNMEFYCVRRMFFPVSDAKNDAAVLSHANNLRQMLAKGTDFGSLAVQFSKSPDAGRGGEIGWIFRGQLSSEEDAKLAGMRVGETAIVRNSRGYAILLLQDKKEAGTAALTTVKVVQVAVPFGESAPAEEELRQLTDYAVNLKRISGDCRELIKNARDSGICAVSEPITIALEAMQPQFRSKIAALRPGCASDPITAPGAVVIFCLLDKKTREIPEPTAAEIKSQKMNERLSVFSDREIRDLRKKSDIKTDEKYRLESNA
ncbi:MAG: peptidylprolyl isomerase [Holosporaceae bacterium]|nr:peptidylprolyl isomerase [Holosporaceae bacterium]